VIGSTVGSGDSCELRPSGCASAYRPASMHLSGSCSRHTGLSAPLEPERRVGCLSAADGLMWQAIRRRTSRLAAQVAALLGVGYPQACEVGRAGPRCHGVAAVDVQRADVRGDTQPCWCRVPREGADRALAPKARRATHKIAARLGENESRTIRAPKRSGARRLCSRSRSRLRSQRTPSYARSAPIPAQPAVRSHDNGAPLQIPCDCIRCIRGRDSGDAI
jgi:hypothetical protein